MYFEPSNKTQQNMNPVCTSWDILYMYGKIKASYHSILFCFHFNFCYYSTFVLPSWIPEIHYLSDLINHPRWPRELCLEKNTYRQTCNIRCSLVGNQIVNLSDVVGASPVHAAPTTSSFSTEHMVSVDWAKTTARWDEKHLDFGIWCHLYQRFDSSSCWYASSLIWETLRLIWRIIQTSLYSVNLIDVQCILLGVIKFGFSLNHDNDMMHSISPDQY